MRKRSKVLILSPMPPPCGGIGNWSQLMVRRSAIELGDSVVFFDTNIKRKSRLHGGLLSLILEGYFALLLQFWGLLRSIVHRDIGVIHSCSSGGLSFFRDVYAGLICKLLRKRFVVHLHFGRLPEVLKASSFENRLCRVVLKLADALIAIDKRTYDCLLALPRVNSVLIPNATDVPADTIAAARRNVIVFAGWVVKTKGIEELLSAWDAIAPSDWRLEVIGPYDASYLEELRERFTFRGVDVLGELDQQSLIGKFKTSKVMCLPSYTEGFPFVVIEAMASGCAVVATNVGAIPEILADGRGLIVPREDVHSLRCALVELLEDDSKVEQLSCLAVATVKEKYDLSTIYKCYRKVWGI